MSTTGCEVSTSVVVAAELAQRGGRAAARSAARPSPSSTKQRTRLVDRGEVPVQELLRLVRLGGDEGALAQLQRRLLRRRPVAARAGDQNRS